MLSVSVWVAGRFLCDRQIVNDDEVGRAFELVNELTNVPIVALEHHRQLHVSELRVPFRFVLVGGRAGLIANAGLPGELRQARIRESAGLLRSAGRTF